MKHQGIEPLKLLFDRSRMYREVDPHIEEGNSPVKLFLEANKNSIELDGMNSGPWKAFELRFKDPLKPLKEFLERSK